MNCTDAFHLTSGAGATVAYFYRNTLDTATGADSWQNEIGSGDTQANVTTDFNMGFADNKYANDA